MQFEEAAWHLAVRAGVDALVPDASGAVAIAFGEVTVNLRPAGQGASGFCLDTRLDRLPSPEAVVDLMADNRWPRGSGAGVLGLDVDGTVMLLHHFSGAQLSSHHFVTTVDRFARRAAGWQVQLRSATYGSRPAAAFTGKGVLA